MSDTVHLERRLSPEECRNLCEDALETLGRGDAPLARQLFETARKYDPFSWRPIQGLGKVALLEGRFEDAWALALAAFEAADDDPDNASLLLEAAKGADRHSQARPLLAQAALRHRTADHLAPFRPAPDAGARRAEELCAKGEELLGSELWREAMFPFLEAMEENPRNAQAWSGLGISYWRQNFREAGLEAFRRAVKENPSDEDAVLNLSESLARCGRAENVLDTLLALRVPRELCGKALDALPDWKA